MFDISGMHWRKSSYSGGGNDCVEVTITEDGAMVRDSKNPGQGIIAFAHDEWRVFLDAVRSGKLDLS